MNKKNGMMTFFVIGLGSMLLILAWYTAFLAERYYQQAVQYYDGIEAIYLAESAINLGWQDLQQHGEKPGMKEGPYGLGAEGRHVFLTVVPATPQSDGRLRANSRIDRSGTEKTMKLWYKIVETDGQPRGEIQKITY